MALIRVPRTSSSTAKKCLYIPQPYGMFVLKRRLQLKGMPGAGTYGLATCVSVLLVSSNQDHIYISHFDQADKNIGDARTILNTHINEYRRWSRDSECSRTAIIGSMPRSALGKALYETVVSNESINVADPNEVSTDSFLYFPKSGNIRWVQDPAPGTHQNHFNRCLPVADRISRLGMDTCNNRAFRYQAP